MVEAGRERDKQIAKLKGMVAKTGKELVSDKTFAEWTLENLADVLHIQDKDDNRRWRYCSHWSTSWNDAKELWDELPFDKRYYENQNEDYSITYAVKVLGEFSYGKDFPDVVSRAWIKYFEQSIKEGSKKL